MWMWQECRFCLKNIWLSLIIIFSALIFRSPACLSGSVLYIENRPYVIGLQHHYAKINIEYEKGYCSTLASCNALEYYAELSSLLSIRKKKYFDTEDSLLR